MKKYIVIIISVVCFLSNTSFAQQMVGPKAAKKEQKMIKKQNKIEKKEYNGHHHKADKKRSRARRKTAKLNAKKRHNR